MKLSVVFGQVILLTCLSNWGWSGDGVRRKEAKEGGSGIWSVSVNPPLWSDAQSSLFINA